MKKRFVSKKKRVFKWRYVGYLFLAYVTFQLTMYFANNLRLARSNEDFIMALLEDSSYHTKYEKGRDNLFYRFFEFVTHVDVKNPVTILKNSFGLPGEEAKVVSKEEVTASNEGYIKDPLPNNKDPLVYIYNSHQLENYDNRYVEHYHITPNVMMASILLKERLEERGIGAVVEEANIVEFMRMNQWSHSDSYQASRYYIEEAMREYPDLKLMIDLHRDAVDRDVSTIEIDGKSYARVLFVVGLENSRYRENLDLAKTMNQYIESKYPALTRGIMKKEGADVDGVYNQDLSPNMVLIEVGSGKNTIEEVLNTLGILAEVIEESL